MGNPVWLETSSKNLYYSRPEPMGLGSMFVYAGWSMLQFNFKKNARKCCVSDEPFQPSEKFYSALVECEEGDALRRDYSEENWDGPPESCLGWWVARIPEPGKKRVYWAPGNVMLAYFDHIQSNPESADVAFVTALLMVQRKLLVVDQDDGDVSRMRLSSRADKRTYEIPVIDISEKRLAAIQTEMADRLFMDQPVDSDNPSELDYDQVRDSDVPQE